MVKTQKNQSDIALDIQHLADYAEKPYLYYLDPEHEA